MQLDDDFEKAIRRVNHAREELALAEDNLRGLVILGGLIHTSPEDFLSEADQAEWAEWAEKNRLRKARISMETGIGHVG